MVSDLENDRRAVFLRSLEADLQLQNLNLGSLSEPSTPHPQADYLGRRKGNQSPETRLQLSGSEERHSVSTAEFEPHLHFCESASDNRLYESLRLQQRVPSGRRLGRQLRVLVYDSSQSGLVGAIGLASPLYRLGCRDRYFGWAAPSSPAIRHFGLRRTMDLAVCVSMPSYSGTRMTKLLAMLAISKPVAERYAARYGEPLLAVITTCGTGLHCACFNRIMIRTGGLFKKVGETAGYTTSYFSNATIRAARELVLGANGTSSVMVSRGEGLPVLRTAMKRLKLPHERLLRMGVHKAVYIAVSYQGALPALREADPSGAGEYLTVSEAVEFWRSRVVPNDPLVQSSCSSERP
jgi:hypothetical protein